jgi:exonuclease SbcC
MEELNRYQKFLALCTEFVRQKNSVVKIKDELDRTEIKITEIKNKIATAEELNEKNEEALKQKIVEKTALEKLFSIAEETQKVQDIQNNLKIGDVCPVCGTSIERFNIQPINGEELSKVREMRDRAEIERNRLYLGTVDLDKQLNGLNVGLKNALESSENIKKNLFEIKTEMVYITRDIPTELMESEYPIIICDKKINEINLSVKENSRKEKELSGEIDSLKEEISDIGKKVENSRANIEVKKQIVASRNTDVAGFEKEWGEKVEEFGFKNIEDAGLFCLSVNEINFLEERISKYKKDLDIVKIKIKNIENEIGDYKKYSKEEIEKLLEEENKKAELVKVELERLEGDIIDRIKSIQEAETIEKQLTSLINEKTELEKKYFVLEKIQKDFSNKGILPFITSAVLSDLIKKSNIYLHKLTAGKMALVLNGEDNLFVLEEGSSEARNVNTLSGGETFLCSLALALGLKDILTEDSLINSFFIDEGFGTLDENVVQFVAETLGGLENDRNQIGIITHRRDLVEKFGDVLEIRKVRGISQVEKIK